MRFLCWEVGDGSKINIGLDVIKGMVGNYSLSYYILNFLHNKEIIFLKQSVLHDDQCIDRQSWTCAGDIQMPRVDVCEWEVYIINLKNAGISLND